MDLIKGSASINLIHSKVVFLFCKIEFPCNLFQSCRNNNKHIEVYSSYIGRQMYSRDRETRPGPVISLDLKGALHFFGSTLMFEMLNIIELFNLVSFCYLNCYRTYLDILNDDNTLELRTALLHRMHIYYEILEIIYDSQHE